MSETSPALSEPMPIEAALPARPASERFERLAEIGAGGMARVLLVRDRALGREVALKVPATPTPADALRIEREALVLARLDHPAIVALYDSGRWDDQPWLAMRLVRGVTLEAALATPSPSLLRHVLAATEAMAHAHARGYVHRDLKPANIMVGELGETQVIDWGLALAPDLTPLDGPRAGTASMMSPEQRRGETVDPRSDVWALGLILGAVARGARLASPELDAIVTRATADDPAARYPDARGLSEDLAAYLDGRRVRAYTYRPLDLLRRLLVAWRRELIIAGVCAIALVVFAISAFNEVRDARDISEERLATMLARESRRALSVEDRARAEVLAAESHALSPTPETRGLLAAVDDSRPLRRDLGIDLEGCGLADLSPSRFLCRSPAHVELRGPAGAHWRTPLDNAGAALLGDHVAALTADAVVFLGASDGRPRKTIALTGCRHRLLRGRGASALAFSSGCGVVISDHAGPALERRDNPCPAPGLRAMGLDPSSGRAVSICHDGSTWVDGTRYDTGLATDPASPLAFSVAITGQTLAIGESHGAIVLIDLANPRAHRRHPLHEGLVRELIVSPGGELLAFGDTSGPALFSPRREATLWRFAHARALATFDGDSLVVADRGVERWELGPLRPRALDLRAGITALALSEDNTRLAVGSGTDLYVVDTTTRAILQRHQWQDSVVSTIAAVPGARDFIAHGQGALRVERIGTHPTTLALPRDLDPSLRFRRLIALADGSVMFAAFGRAVGRLGPDEPLMSRQALIDLATDPRGEAVVGLDEERFLWCTPALVPCGRDLIASAVATADPDRFATARSGSLATFTFRGELVRTYAAEQVEFLDLAIARRPDGVRVLAGAGRDGSTWLFAEDRPDPWAVLRDHEARVSAVALDTLGRFAVVGGWDGRLVFWPVPTSQADRRQHARSLWGLELSELVPTP